MRRMGLATVLMLVSLIACSHDTALVVASPSGDSVLVTQDQKDMQAVVDCALKRTCQLPVMPLLAERKAYLLPTGTPVSLQDGFSLSTIRKIRVEEGEHAGKEVWVYGLMLRSEHLKTSS